MAAATAVAGGAGTGVAALFGDAAETRRLAALHVAADPAAAARAALLGEVLGGRAEAARFLATSRSVDLAAGRIAVVDGWVMARCEADLLLAVASTQRDWRA